MDSLEPARKQAKLGCDNTADVQLGAQAKATDKPLKTDHSTAATAPVVLVPLEELKEILSPINDAISALREEVKQLRQQQSLVVSEGPGTMNAEVHKPEEEDEEENQDDDDDTVQKSSKSLKWIEVCAHCKDACDVVAYDEHDKELVQYDGYAPSFLSLHGAVHVKIDVATGTIKGWNKLTPVQILADLSR